MKKKIIILNIKDDNGYRKGIKLLKKYPNNNIIIKNYTEKNIDGFDIIDNIKINKNIDKYINELKSDKDKAYDITGCV